MFPQPPLYPQGKIYLNSKEFPNLYKYGEEIHSLYRALNNLETSVSQLHLSLEDVEKTKEDIKKRIAALEQEVMNMSNPK